MSWQPHASELLSKLPKTYAMAEIVAEREAMRARGIDVLDASIGEPVLEPAAIVREALARAAAEVAFNRYPELRGARAVRVAFAELYKRRYGAELDPDREVLLLLGSKEGIINLGRAFADRERPVYSGAVGYPVYRAAALYAGAEHVALGGTWEDSYRPAFVSPMRRGGVAFVSSPGNPTSAVLDRDDITRFAEACREREAVLCFDAAYAELAGERGPTLAIPTVGTQGVVELHSLSKSLSVAGWRCAFAVGDAELIDGLARVKSFCDAGVPSPQQHALAQLLPVSDELFDRTRRESAALHRALRTALAALPLELLPTDSGMFCWLRPGRPGADFVRACLREGVVIAPGSMFGAAGSDCVRFSATLPAARMAELTVRLQRVLESPR